MNMHPPDATFWGSLGSAMNVRDVSPEPTDPPEVDPSPPPIEVPSTPPITVPGPPPEPPIRAQRFA